jgi:hypothetical protein
MTGVDLQQNNNDKIIVPFGRFYNILVQLDGLADFFARFFWQIFLLYIFTAGQF